MIITMHETTREKSGDALLGNKLLKIGRVQRLRQQEENFGEVKTCTPILGLLLLRKTSPYKDRSLPPARLEVFIFSFLLHYADIMNTYVCMYVDHKYACIYARKKEPLLSPSHTGFFSKSTQRKLGSSSTLIYHITSS